MLFKKQSTNKKTTLSFSLILSELLLVSSFLNVVQAVTIVTNDTTIFSYNNTLDINALKLAKTLKPMIEADEKSDKSILLDRVDASCWQRIVACLKLLHATYMLEGTDQKEKEQELLNMIASFNKDALFSFTNAVDFLDCQTLLDHALEQWISCHATTQLDTQNSDHVFNPVIERTLQGKLKKHLLAHFAIDGDKPITIKKPHGILFQPMSNRSHLDFIIGANRLVDVQYSPDGKSLTAMSLEGNIFVWDTQTGEIIQTLTERKGPGNFISYSPSGSCVAFLKYDNLHPLPAGGPKNDLCIWHILTKQFHHTHTINKVVTALCYQPDGTHIVYISGKELYFYDVRTGTIDRTIKIPITGNVVFIHKFCFSPNGASVAVSYDNVISILEIHTGLITCTIKDTSKYISTLCYSPDSKTIASGSNDGTIKIWNSTTGELMRTMAHTWTYPISHIHYSPDGTTLISASSWDAAVWNPQRDTRLHTVDRTQFSGSISYSPDGTFLASTHGQKVHLWDFTASLKKLLDESSYEQLLFLKRCYQKKNCHELVPIKYDSNLYQVFDAFDQDQKKLLRHLFAFDDTLHQRLKSHAYKHRTELALSIGIGLLSYLTWRYLNHKG